MKTLILSITICASLGLSGCANFKPADAQVLVKPVAMMASVNYIKKHNDSIPRVLALAETLELAADAATGQLTKEQFISLVSKISDEPEWRILGIYIWDLYIHHSSPVTSEKNVKILRDISTGLRDSILITSASK